MGRRVDFVAINRVIAWEEIMGGFFIGHSSFCTTLSQVIKIVACIVVFLNLIFFNAGNIAVIWTESSEMSVALFQVKVVHLLNLVKVGCSASTNNGSTLYLISLWVITFLLDLQNKF